MREGAKPKALEIKNAKQKFITALTVNGGNVSKALKSANLVRRTAYLHFASDDEFAADWLNAMEESFDELYDEARNRAIVGELKTITSPSGSVTEYYEKSDVLLIHLLKTGEINKKWRNRIIQVGNLALDTIKDAGLKHNLSDEVIDDIQNMMTENFKQIQFI